MQDAQTAFQPMFASSVYLEAGLERMTLHPTPVVVAADRGRSARLGHLLQIPVAHLAFETDIHFSNIHNSASQR